MNVHPNPVPNAGAPVVPFTLLPEARKGVTNLLLRIGPEISEEDIRVAFKNLLKGLNDGEASVVVLTSPSALAEAQACLNDAQFDMSRCRIYQMDDYDLTGIQYWPRDSLLWALQGGSWAVIRNSHQQPGNLDGWVISNIAPINFDKTGDTVDGGDSLVVDRDFWILGDGSIGMTMLLADPPISWRATVAQISADMDRTPIPVGISPETAKELKIAIRWLLAQVRANFLIGRRRSGRRPTSSALVSRLYVHVMAFVYFLKSLYNPYLSLMGWAHVDMVVAVTGTTTRDGKPTVLVAQTTARGCPQTPEAEDMEFVLSYIARKLRKAGLNVIRNPAPFREKMVLPYNNVIVQIEPNIVWLPTFAAEGGAEKSVDDRNIEIWRALGFRVIEVPGWYRHATKGRGCIRCATLPVPCLRRTDRDVA